MTASPEKIGKSFIKQYYQTLLASPAQLVRFYQADSTISRGNAAHVASTTCCAEALSAADPGEALKAFFDFSEGELSIDFSSGAIDAQESGDGGILLVVTGHMNLPLRTGFVHTFFLSNAAPKGSKKVFYVKNDVLRFLGEPQDRIVDVEEPAAVHRPDEEPLEEPQVAVDYATAPAAEEETMEIIDTLHVEALDIAQDEPAAEEEKMDATLDSSPDSPATSKGSDGGKRSKRHRRKRGGKSSRSNSPSDKDDAAAAATTAESSKQDTTETPKPPGSWASLVATGQPNKSESGGGSNNSKGRRSSPKSSRRDTNDNKSTADTTSHHEKPPQDRTAKPSNESTSTPPTTTASSNSRTPEATLFIRNVPDATKESEIRALFEPIVASSGNKILGITLNPHRGFCFVDFDSVQAVDAVVKEAETSLVKEPRTGRKVTSTFMVHGRVLDVERKVKENKFRGSRGRAGMRRSPPRGR